MTYFLLSAPNDSDLGNSLDWLSAVRFRFEGQHMDEQPSADQDSQLGRACAYLQRYADEMASEGFDSKPECPVLDYCC